MKTDGLITEHELLKRWPMSPRQLKELRYQRKIPFVKVSHRLRLYNPTKVAAALERLEVREVE